MQKILLIRSASMIIFENAVTKITSANCSMDLLTTEQSVVHISDPALFDNIYTYREPILSPKIISSNSLQTLCSTKYDRILFLVNNKFFELWRYKAVLRLCASLTYNHLTVMNGYLCENELKNCISPWLLSIQSLIERISISTYISLVTVWNSIFKKNEKIIIYDTRKRKCTPSV